MKQTKPLIEFKNIFLKFKDKTILKNFNLQIFPKDKIVISGASGIGKSTLFNLILGFVQAQNGEIFFQGKKVNAKNIHSIRSQIAYLDQDLSLGTDFIKEIIQDYFSFEVNREIALDKNKLTKLLEEFSLDQNILNKNINRLSGGEKQRIGLIIALLLDRPLLLLDEISSALDPKLVQQVITKILKLENKTIILIAHNREWQKQKDIRVFNFGSKKWQ